jgi:hypothetical protein
VEAAQVRASGGQLYITAVRNGEAQVRNLAGQTVKVIPLAAGQTVAHPYREK